jgi:hypothetical protein
MCQMPRYPAKAELDYFIVSEAGCSCCAMYADNVKLNKLQYFPPHQGDIPCVYN